MSDFQKRHYVAIADCIKTSTSTDTLIENLVSMFRRDNPRFDSDRFIEACKNENERSEPEQVEDWRRYFDKDGRIVKPEE